MAAALAVLHLPELLENILLYLEDWQEAFILQRVNQRFKATIERSIHLRRKMWLAPKLSSKDIDLTEDTSVTYCRPDPLGELLYNPLLMRDVPGRGFMRWPNVDKGRFFFLPLSTPRSISTSAVPVHLVFNSLPKVYMISKDVELGPCTTMGALMDSVRSHLDEVQKRVRNLREAAKKNRKGDRMVRGAEVST
ncbi:hypothetical protein B0A48_03797 [Cryoendolithus antarcticus]|uniref:F-box domain-containing protein n=1 Tax=Cryoendolithus antarcticus TaxID=1507870 RepID=A0A1V8TGJ8_9PEZI|nr:hypothetical protein B0A48_03797 [Cryoendolithus antarcticus]